MKTFHRHNSIDGGNKRHVSQIHQRDFLSARQFSFDWLNEFSKAAVEVDSTVDIHLHDIRLTVGNEEEERHTFKYHRENSRQHSKHKKQTKKNWKLFASLSSVQIVFSLGGRWINIKSIYVQ